MQRKNIMVLMISLSLVLLLGSSYALLRSTVVGENPYVINVGTLQVTFEDGKTDNLSLENMYPMSDKEGMSQTAELGFTVTNIGTVASYYDITLEETSVSPEFKSVIRFISNKDSQGYNEPKTLSEDKYIDVGGYLEPDASSSYKVKVWLDYNAGNTYMDKTFTAKVVINSFQESEYAKDVVKSKLVKYEESSKEDFTGGVVAVNTDGKLYNETDESQKIREYRYSGPSVNNYVTFNDELWRIIGVFKDEVGEEHVKIVRNEVLTANIFPETYTIDGIEYSIKGSSGNNAAWNKKANGTHNNDWATAGLQYWLNTSEDETEDSPNQGYLSYLKENNESMIETTKYYLGTVTYKHIDNLNYGIIDTPKEAYLYERAVEGCNDGIGPAENTGRDLIFENTPTCRVWANNQATWEGKVALMYPSDYGFSTRINYWETSMMYGSFNGDVSNTSWLQNTVPPAYNWLLSPSSLNYDRAVSWNTPGHLDTDLVDIYYRYADVRPSLYLKNNVKITSGDGTSTDPYNLTIE